MRTLHLSSFFKLALLLVSIAFLLGAIAIAFINLPIGKNLFNKKVKSIIGKEITYNRILPVRLDCIKITDCSFTPNELVKLPSILIDLNVWKTLKTQDIVLDKIHLEEPSINLKLESLLRRIKKPGIKKDPPAQLPSKETTQSELPPLKKPPVGKPNEQTRNKLNKDQISRSKPKKNKYAFPEILINNASIKISSKRFPQLNSKITGINLVTKSNDAHQKGELSIKRIIVGDNDYSLHITQSLDINGRIIRLPKTEHVLQGLKLTLAGELALYRSLPFFLETHLDQDSPKKWNLSSIPETSTETESIHIELLTQGYAINPLSYKALSFGKVNGIDLLFRNKQAHHFDEGSYDLSLGRGRIILPKFKLISDDLSFLGNGFSSMNGSLSGVFRMVGSPHWKEEYQRLCNGLILRNGARKITPLNLPDRFYKDFFLKSEKDFQLQYLFEGGEQWTPIEVLLSRLKWFINMELNEE